MFTERPSSLEFVWTTRPGGDGRTERRYRDIVVNGIALSSAFGGDVISSLGWGPAAIELSSIERLLMRAPCDCPAGRTSLYVCPECGDLACGAVTLIVERGSHCVVWRDFGFQNDYEDFVDRSAYSRVGPFFFESDPYEQIVEQLMRDAQFRGV